MSSPLSILHVDLTKNFGGTERYCADLAARQLAAGHRVSLVARSKRPGQKDAVQDHVQPGVAVYETPGLLARFAVARAVREQSVDIINVHMGSSARPVRALRRRPPAVMTLHLPYVAKEARRMAGLICVAEWQKSMIDGFDRPVTVARNWPPARQPVSDAQVRALRERLGAGPGTVVVGFIGRLDAVKGVDQLIGAYRTWAGLDTRLAIVGAGVESEALTAMAAGDPTIHFLGHAKPADPWYGAMDLVVLPSRWEGLPLVLLEAMRAGAPILASATPGAVEALAGSPATLVAPSRAALTEALGALIGRARAGRLPRLAYDLSPFSPESSLPRIETFYREIIAREHGRSWARA